MPTLNEAHHLALQLRRLRSQLPDAEIIVTDGGSSDATRSIAQALADRVVAAERGRALQMNAGAAIARGRHLLFLHADCCLPEEASLCAAQIREVTWGFFPARLNGRHPLLRVVERLMNARSRATSVATGDQGLLISHSLFASSGGFANQPLMEDVEFCKRLRRVGKPAYLPVTIMVSSRRWEEHGIIRTILLMWCLRFAYVLGVSPQRLHRWYYG